MQGYKRDLFFRDRDETETETFRDPDRDVFEMSQTVFVHLLRKTQFSITVLQKLLRHFPNDCQQFK